jgi:phospholipid transport system substrate-binding protein
MKKFLAALFLTAFSFQAHAQNSDKSEDVKTFVEKVGNQIISVASEKTTSEAKKREKIINVIDSVIDSEWIAHFVLGKNFKIMNEEQKVYFTKLYRDFMINTYGPKFKNYNGRSFNVLEVTKQNNFYIAKSEFLPRDSNVSISVNFRVKDRGDKLVILDFVAEGVSLIETQRSEFNSAISENGIDKFLENLAVRVENLKKNDVIKKK